MGDIVPLDVMRLRREIVRTARYIDRLGLVGDPEWSAMLSVLLDEHAAAQREAIIEHGVEGIDRRALGDPIAALAHMSAASGTE